MLSQNTPLDEIIRNRYQGAFDQLARQIAQEQHRLLQTITPLDEAERRLACNTEILGLQREILAEAGAQRPLTAEKIAQLSQHYQARLEALKGDLAAGYQVLLNARDYVFEDSASIPLNAIKRSELLTHFQSELARDWPAYQAFQIHQIDEERLHSWQAALDRGIANAIEEVEYFQAQKTTIIELSLERQAFLGEQQQAAVTSQQAIAQTPHYLFSNACIAGDLPAVKRLLDGIKQSEQRLAFINQLGVSGRSALHQACGHGHFVIVKYLLEQGANPQRLDSEGYQPLHYAVIKPVVCTTTILEVLWRACKAALDINSKGPYGRTPLHTAALFGNLAAVQWLVRRGACLDLAEHGAAQRTPLHNAAFKGHIEVTKCLLKAGANPILSNANQESPLFEALFYGQESVARLFAEKRIGLNHAEKNALLQLLPDRPALRHCLIRFLQEEVDLYTRAGAVEAASHLPAPQLAVSFLNQPALVTRVLEEQSESSLTR